MTVHKSINYYDGNTTLTAAFFPLVNSPSLILFPAFEGQSPFALDYALKLHAQGYQVFVADMYGHQALGKTLPECIDLITPFLNDRNLVRKRAVLAYEALLLQPSVNKNLIGAFGFCFGGMCALELIRSGLAIQAAACIHGVLAPSSLKTECIQAHVLILHGFQDPQVPPECLPVFAKEMHHAKHQDWQFIFFGDAKHAFSDPRTGQLDPKKEAQMGREYNQKVALKSSHYLLSFFDEYLKN